jgi:hypothetical protein
MKGYGGVTVYLHVFLTSALVGGEWSASRLSHFTPEKSSCTHWIGGWVGTRPALNDVEKIPAPTGTRTLTLQSSSL